MAETDLQAETTEVLQRLVRVYTVNPPGDERAAQEYLADYLSAAGLECELLGATPERPNLVARLPGAGDGPVLGYLGHVDTVLASPGDWSHDPWSGDLADGCLWGRGALDMKSQVAAEAVAAAHLARSGWRPARGALCVFSVVDEETGGELGAQWLTREHPDKARCDLLLNEGAGEVFAYRGRRRYGVCCAEKGIFRFTVSTRGTAGHASMPRLGDNALLKLAPLLQRLGERRPAFAVTEAPAALLRGLDEDPDDPAGALARLGEDDPRLTALVEPMLGVTLAPTKVRASEKINVIPAEAALQVDCRVPPGLGEDAARAAAREVLGSDGYELAFSERVVGNQSPVDTPLMRELRRWVGEVDPEADVVPTILPGFSDSRWWRAAFPECVAYGFFPQRHMDLFAASPLVHGADERIDVRDLGFAAACYAALPPRLLG
jgi:acetylornithine deacetylase/succinyl-diaminopimelate desuccinylase-like protein